MTHATSRSAATTLPAHHTNAVRHALRAGAGVVRGGVKSSPAINIARRPNVE